MPIDRKKTNMKPRDNDGVVAEFFLLVVAMLTFVVFAVTATKVASADDPISKHRVHRNGDR